MRAYLRIGTALALAVATGGCALLGGGGKPPPVLFTLSSDAPPAAAARTAAVGQTVTIATPVIPKQLRTVRVPVEIGLTQVQYVANLQWVDTPDRLFQALLEETVRRTTNRVVLDPSQTTLDPGLVVSGQLNRFGYDTQQGVVVVQYDGSLATQGGTHVESRRFEFLPDVGLRHDFCERVAPLLDDRPRRVRRSKQRDPGIGGERVIAFFRERRDAWQRRLALLAGNGQRAQLSALQELRDAAVARGHEIDLPADHGEHGGRGAFVGDVSALHPGLQTQRFADQMRGGPGARRRIIERPGLPGLDQVPEVDPDACHLPGDVRVEVHQGHRLEALRLQVRGHPHASDHRRCP